jgi:signal transduction histidine kinase/tetratricopeptide (TPR) repeat protein
MLFFDRNDIVDRLAAIVDRAGVSDDRLPLAVELAWYLRQRDNVRARALRDAVSARLAAQSPVHPASALWRHRLALVTAETLWLESELEDAASVARGALLGFTDLGDATGCADAQAMLAAIHNSEGNHPLRDECLGAAVRSAQQVHDSQRVDFFEAYQARYAALGDVRQSDALWGHRFAQDTGELHPSVAAAVCGYFAVRDFNTGQFASALVHLNHSFDASLQTGQLLSAVIVTVNAGSTYVNLNDHDAALEWVQRGLDLARNTTWAVALGSCLRQMGEIMRAMGRVEAAQAFLDEAMQVHLPLRNSRNFSVVATALGELALARGDYPRALELFRQMVERAQSLSQNDQLISARIGVAGALLELKDDAGAEQEVMAALRLAEMQGAAVWEIVALRLLARVHAFRQQPALALNRLEQALAQARQIDGFLIPGDLLLLLAQEYAHAGRYQEAYQMAVQAGAARERVLNQQASNRATAMQVRLDTERSRAETEHHRRLAEAESRRATLLQRTSDTLERLGTIGQEITSQLDKEQVFETIERHVHGLLDASSFTIYLMDSDGLGLTSVYDMEEGVRIASDHVRMDDAHSFSARCVRERRELLVDFGGTGSSLAHLPGTLVTQSALFAPLTISERVLGVMTIQSLRSKAYAENERLIFRTLCAYTAIALDNAVAYMHLRDAKDQLVVQEKLAALGALVAGVAHELNTPIGNALLTASTLQEKTEVMGAAAASGSLRRSSLNDYIADSREGLELVTRGLRSAGDLVQSFKQVAVDRATEQRRRFDLLRTSLEVVATLQRSILLAGQRIEIDIPADLVLDSYPGPYGQVLTNLINNALLHAFGERKGGTMRLQALPAREDHVEIRFTDDGVGISAQNLKRIFDPFFTTKLGQGGSGLGMSISYNIVKALFGGIFEVSSTPGEGSCFVLRLPLVAPQHAAGKPHTDAARKRSPQ